MRIYLYRGFEKEGTRSSGCINGIKRNTKNQARGAYNSIAGLSAAVDSEG